MNSLSSLKGITNVASRGIIWCHFETLCDGKKPHKTPNTFHETDYDARGEGEGATLGISGWGCAAGTMEPLAYTRASFSWILLPYTRVNSPNHSYPRIAVFQKLRSLVQSKAKPKQNLIPQSLFS